MLFHVNEIKDDTFNYNNTNFIILLVNFIWSFILKMYNIKFYINDH